jgi:hypothetical protein
MGKAGWDEMGCSCNMPRLKELLLSQNLKANQKGSTLMMHLKNNNAKNADQHNNEHNTTNANNTNKIK